MTVRTSRRTGRTLAGMVLASTLVAACGGSGGSGGGEASSGGDTTGVTDTTVKIGAHVPLTGPAAPGYSEIPAGAKAYFDFVNAAGGVNGRTVDYVFRDDAYNPTQTAQVTNQLLLQDEVFATMGSIGTPTHNAAVELLNEEGVPDLFVATGSVKFNDPDTYPTTFMWQPDYEVEGKIIGQYIAENFPDAKVGLFLQGDDVGVSGAEGVKRFAGEQVVSEVTYTPGNTDIGTQIAELEADGADLVVGFNTPSYTALSQLGAQRLGYKPTWFYSNIASDATLVSGLLSRISKGAVKDGSALLEGVMTTQFLPTVADDDPWIDLFREVWTKHGKGDLTNFNVYGMSQAYTAVSALQAAGEDLTREGLIEALEEEGGDFTGPWLAPIEYSGESHRGITGVRVVSFAKGLPVPKTGILTTAPGDAAVEEFEGEPAVPAEDGLPDAG